MLWSAFIQKLFATMRTMGKHKTQWSAHAGERTAERTTQCAKMSPERLQSADAERKRNVSGTYAERKPIHAHSPPAHSPIKSTDRPEQTRPDQPRQTDNHRQTIRQIDRRTDRRTDTHRLSYTLSLCLFCCRSFSFPLSIFLFHSRMHARTHTHMHTHARIHAHMHTFMHSLLHSSTDMFSFHNQMFMTRCIVCSTTLASCKCNSAISLP